MHILITFIFLFTISFGHCQLSKYDKYHNTSKPDFESDEFVIWAGDTLNIRNGNGRKTGKWIEYKTNYYIQKSSYLDMIFTDQPNESEPIVEVDTISINFKIQGIGNYQNGLRIGQWATFYNNKTLKAEVSFNEGKVSGIAKIYYNKWPSTIKYLGMIMENNKQTKFKFFNEEGTLISTEEHSLYQLLGNLEKQSASSNVTERPFKNIDF